MITEDKVMTLGGWLCVAFVACFALFVAATCFLEWLRWSPWIGWYHYHRVYERGTYFHAPHYESTLIPGRGPDTEEWNN